MGNRMAKTKQARDLRIFETKDKYIQDSVIMDKKWEAFKEEQYKAYKKILGKLHDKTTKIEEMEQTIYTLTRLNAKLQKEIIETAKDGCHFVDEGE